MALRNCQELAIQAVKDRRSANEQDTNLSLCTGAGKSIIIREITKEPERIILVFPWLDLLTQYYDEHYSNYTHHTCIRYLATEGTLSKVQRMSTTMTELDENSYVIFTTYTSAPLLYSNLSSPSQVDLLIHDEAHRIERAEYKASLGKASGMIKHTVNLSATLSESKVPHYKYPLLRGIKDGVVRDFHMELFLCVEKERNETTILLTIVRKLLSLHKQVKLLVYTAEANTDGETSSSVKTFMDRHSKELRAQGWWIEGINEETKDRKKLLREFEKNKNKDDTPRDVSILVSCKTLTEGIDLKGGNGVLPWDPSASVKDNVQRIGRVLRLYKTREGVIKKDQPASTVLIPVFLHEEKYLECGGDKEKINALLCKEIAEGERGNFRPIVSVCTALKEELAEEDEELFNRLLNYPYEPKVTVNRNLVECVAKECKKSAETVLEEVVEALEGKVDEEQLELVKQGDWGDEIVGEVAQALADTQKLTLVVRDGDEAAIFGTGETELAIEKKKDDEGYKVVRGARAAYEKEKAKKQVAQRLRVEISDGCKVLLGLDTIADADTTGNMVLSRLTTEVKYDEDWEKRRLEWVVVYQKLGRCPRNSSSNLEEKCSAQWQSDQRKLYKTRSLRMTYERVTLLEDNILTPGWKWEGDDNWDENLQKWIIQFNKLGCTPSQTSSDKDERLAGNWQRNQRINYRKKKGKLTPERIERLNNTPGWKWEEDDHWQNNLKLWCVQFKKLGRCPTHSSDDYDEKYAGEWQKHQRGYYNRKKLHQEYINILNNTDGWQWSADDKWEKKRQQWITQYTKKRGNPSPGSSDIAERNAAQWQGQQRKNYNQQKKSQMTPERIAILNSTPGWSWRDEDTWTSNHQLWVNVVKEGKKPNQESSEPDIKKAGQWQSDMRQLYSKKNTTILTSERRIILEDPYQTPGWKWKDDRWEDSYQHWIYWFMKNKGKYPRQKSEDSDEKRAGAWQSNQRRLRETSDTEETQKKIKILDETPGWKWSEDELPKTPYVPAESLESTPAPRARKPIKAPPQKDEKSSNVRKLSKFEAYHQRFKTMNSDTYKESVKPEEFEDYHALADTYDARDPPERQPINKVAALLAKLNKSSYKAIDLGCGKNRLRTHESVSKMSWTSVDVHAVDDTVTVADMGALPFEEESFDIAVLSRSLWARNHLDVLKEAYRILKSGGRAVICESFHRWLKQDESGVTNTLLNDLKTTGFEIIHEEGTKMDDSVEVFQYIVVRKG
jgi:superfamily II DNA or RNA helicase